MVHFYLCIDIYTLWSNRLWANPLNITTNDLNANKPCTVKSKMDIYKGKNYKNYTFFLMSGSDACLWQGQNRFSRKKCRKKNPKQNMKEDGGQRKAYLSSFVNHSSAQLCSHILPWHRADSRRPRDGRAGGCQQSTRRACSQFYRKSIYIKLQRGSPIRFCCPLSVRHSLILLFWCTNTVQIWVAPTNFFS